MRSSSEFASRPEVGRKSWRPPSWEAMAATGVVLVGALLRARQYLFARSLWGDEVALALNLTERSLSGLLEPLSRNQAAPISFLILEKLSITAFGANEYAFRLIPFLAGLGALPLLYLVGRRTVGITAALIGLALFAVAEPQIYYTTELKQYASDVFVTLAILFAAVSALRSDAGFPGLTLLGVVGAVGVWFSHPAVFVLGGVSLTLLACEARRGRSRRLVAIVGIAVLWAATFLVEYVVSLRAITANSYLHDFWKFGFLPFPRSPGILLIWVQVVSAAFSYQFGLMSTWLAVALFVLGGAALLRARPRSFALLTAPVGLVLVASLLHKYPFGDRLTLFLGPILSVLVGGGLAFIAASTGREQAIAGVLGAVLLFTPATEAARAFRRPMGREELRPLLQQLSGRLRDQDILYVYYGAQGAFDFYAPRHLPCGIATVRGICSRGNLMGYAADLEQFRGRGRFWVVFSHTKATDIDEELLFLHQLDLMGTRLDQITLTGASAYLYDLTRTTRGGGGSDRRMM